MMRIRSPTCRTAASGAVGESLTMERAHRALVPSDTRNGDSAAGYWPSPKYSPTSFDIASIACSSSGPEISTVIFDPLPAASIITPMMLFAFTLRPLRITCTSLSNFAASCVSLADARACRPSLLMISSSRRCMERSGFDMQHAFATTGHGLLDERVHALRAVSECSHQHRQADAGDHFDAPRFGEFRREVARRRAVDVGQDRNTVAGVEAGDDVARLGQQCFFL